MGSEKEKVGKKATGFWCNSKSLFTIFAFVLCLLISSGALFYFLYYFEKNCKNGQNLEKVIRDLQSHNLTNRNFAAPGVKISANTNQTVEEALDDHMKLLQSLGFRIPLKNRTLIDPSKVKGRISFFVRNSTTTTTTTTTRPLPDTYFSQSDKKFPPVDKSNKIPTEKFLRACEAIGNFTELLGTAFGTIKSDVDKNIEKVRVLYDQDRVRYRYIQDLADKDLKDNKYELITDTPSEGLLWLKRALEFVLELLKLVVEDYRRHNGRNVPQSLVPILEKAYERSLKRHHGFIKRHLFNGLKHMAPYRQTVIEAISLGRKDIENVCVIHIKEYLVNFERNVEILKRYFDSTGLETNE